jgi:hypothetical protein
MKRKTLLATLTAAAVATTAYAHGPKVGRNGGPQVDAGNYHVEIAPKGKALTVFLRDQEDKAVGTTGFKGTAILVVDGKSQRIQLAPAGENTLAGEAAVELPSQPKGAVQITTSAGSTVQAKF